MTNKYVIFFTPRSGSSWLTAALKNTGVLGNPIEWFNPEHVDSDLSRFDVDAGDYRGYLDKVLDSYAKRGEIFGIEVTSVHYDRYLSDFFNIYFNNDDTKFVFLNRGDIVAQAVSLWRAVKTGVFHSIQKSVQPVVEYNCIEIKKWVNHILDQERRVRQILDDLDVSPLRINYETMMTNKIGVLVTIASGMVSPSTISGFDIDNNPYKPLADQASREAVERFYIDQHEFCAEVYSNRPYA